MSLRGRVTQTNVAPLSSRAPPSPLSSLLLLTNGDEQPSLQLLLASSHRGGGNTSTEQASPALTDLSAEGRASANPVGKRALCSTFRFRTMLKFSLPLQDFGLGRRVDTCNSAGMPPPPFPPRGPGKSAPPSLPSGGGACPPYPSDFVICGT